MALRPCAATRPTSTSPVRFPDCQPYKPRDSCRSCLIWLRVGHGAGYCQAVIV
jgi:hypothetical protein